ncbi:MAG: ABC transporter substrate-binding protein, partial [Alphaproteobacteria bacterium]|nr:ABC transporter substrate-binding protein [Alphaproteobacteria bacterium]
MIRILLVLAVLFAAATGAAAAEISDGAVKIGLILDLSGPYSENTGQGSVAAAKMAVADFGGKVLGAPIEVLVEDHHNSADQAAAIARDWFDHKGIDAILDVTGSSEALIVQRIGDVRHKIVSLSGPGADRLTNEACTATSIHYVFDTYSIAHTVGSALVDRGEKTWFFITVD